MRVNDIAREIESLAPKALAQSWDNVGLLVGDKNQEVSKVLFAIDITKDVVKEAIKQGADLIISYHPVIWDGLKKVTADSEKSVVYELIRAGISVYSIHTSLDVVWGGVNDGLAQMVGIESPEPIGDFVSDPKKDLYKLVVFVPSGDVNKVAKAVYDAGAGELGNYSNCSFTSDGVGTFVPKEGANPAVGDKGKLTQVDEVRFETIVHSSRLDSVVSAMLLAHPYEMPAYDVLKIYDLHRRMGLGRMGKLSNPRRLDDIIADIKQKTSAKSIGIVGPKNKTIRSAAVCAGTCGKILNTVISEGCDLYLTGELKHHEALVAQEASLVCLCLSHTVSERFILKKLQQQLKTALKGVSFKISKKDHDPFTWQEI